MLRESVYSLEVKHRIAPPDWEEIRTAQSGSFYLSEAFASIIAGKEKQPLYFRLMDRSRKCCGIALGFLSSPWQRWPLNRLFHRLDFRTHPIVLDKSEDSLNKFCRRIVAFGKGCHAISIHFGSEDAPMSPSGLEELGMIPYHRLEFLVNLDKADEELMSIMHPMRKRNLCKLMKRGDLKVFEDNTEKGMRTMIELQGSSRERRSQRGEYYDIPSKQTIGSVVQQYLARGYARLFFASMNGSPLAGVFLHCDVSSAYYTRAGSSPKGFEIGASQFLVWEMMRQLRHDGYKTLNLGGVPADAISEENPAHGLRFFKSSFGSKEIRCTTWTLENVGIQSKLAKWLLKR